MKFVQGIHLHEILTNLKAGDAATVAEYSLAHLLTIFQKVCDAVAFAHSKNIIHRDLKPANIMVGDYGEVLVMDWGLAKRLDGEESAVEGRTDSEACPPTTGSQSGLTLAGAVMGSPQFMAPEQAAGKADEVDARTDLFALGRSYTTS